MARKRVPLRGLFGTEIVIDAGIAVPHYLLLPKISSLFTSNAANVRHTLGAIEAEGRGVCICFALSKNKIMLVDSLVAIITKKVLEIVNFLTTCLDFFMLQITKNVTVADTSDLRLAHRAAVLHVSDPPVYARVAVLVRTLIKKRFLVD